MPIIFFPLISSRINTSTYSISRYLQIKYFLLIDKSSISSFKKESFKQCLWQAHDLFYRGKSPPLEVRLSRRTLFCSWFLSRFLISFPFFLSALSLRLFPLLIFSSQFVFEHYGVQIKIDIIKINELLLHLSFKCYQFFRISCCSTRVLIY